MSKENKVIEETDDYVVCLFDLVEKKVGCVLLQAAFGGNSMIPHMIGTEHWFLAPTDNMKLYKIPKSEIPKIVAKFRK